MRLAPGVQRSKLLIQGQAANQTPKGCMLLPNPAGGIRPPRLFFLKINSVIQETETLAVVWHPARSHCGEEKEQQEI